MFISVNYKVYSGIAKVADTIKQYQILLRPQASIGFALNMFTPSRSTSSLDVQNRRNRQSYS